MRRSRDTTRWGARAFTAITAMAVIATLLGAGLEGWCVVDRARAPGRASDRLAAAQAVTQRPSAEAFERLAGAQAAAGLASEAATSAVLASRLAPGDARRAALAERAVDAALRATLRGLVRPAAVVGVAVLLLGWIARARRRRAVRRRAAAVHGAVGRIVLSVEGAEETHNAMPVLTPQANALVVDVFTHALALVRDPPPLVVVCSHAEEGRTVRLPARHDALGGAARFRVEGRALAELRAHTGRWRVLARADNVTLAVADLTVAGVGGYPPQTPPAGRRRSLWRTRATTSTVSGRNRATTPC